MLIIIMITLHILKIRISWIATYFHVEYQNMQQTREVIMKFYAWEIN